MIEVLILTTGVLVGLVGGRYFHTKKPIIVEEYRIEHVEKDGFARLILKLEDANHAVRKFEFHPNHAHALSDDLLRQSAQALRPKEVGHG